MQKKRITLIAVVLAVTLIFFVFFSRTMYNRTLPTVKSVKIEKGYVVRTWEGTGTIAYLSETELKSSGNWTVSEVFVEEGDLVEADDLLCLFDTQLFDIEQKNFELDILRLKNEMDTLHEQSIVLAENERFHARKRAEIAVALEIATERLENFNTNAFELEKMNLELDILRLRNELAELKDFEAETDEEERAQRRSRGEVLAALEIAETSLSALHKKDFETERKALELDVLRLENELAELDEKNSGNLEKNNRNRSYTEIASELEIAETRLDRAVSLAPPADGLRASCAGRVYELAVKPGDTLSQGDTVLSLLPDETPSLKFSLPPKEGETFGPGAIVQMTLETVTQNDKQEKVFARKTLSGRVISGVLKEEKWECLASIPRFDERPVGGQEIPIKVSHQGEMQDFVVPVGCLYKKNNTTVVYTLKLRSGLFGTESYLTELEVEVLYDNGKLAVLNAGGVFYQDTTLAYNPSYVMNNGDVVFVKEEYNNPLNS